MSQKIEDGVSKAGGRATRGSGKSDSHMSTPRGQSESARDEASEGDLNGGVQADPADRGHQGHQRSDLGRDAVELAQDNPVATLLIASAIVIGGGLLVARIVHDLNRSDEADRHSSASLVSGWGPKATHTISQIRDAVFGLALMKAVDSLERTFPGFREHFDSSL